MESTLRVDASLLFYVLNPFICILPAIICKCTIKPNARNLYVESEMCKIAGTLEVLELVAELGAEAVPVKTSIRKLGRDQDYSQSQLGCYLRIEKLETVEGLLSKKVYEFLPDLQCLLGGYYGGFLILPDSWIGAVLCIFLDHVIELDGAYAQGLQHVVGAHGTGTFEPPGSQLPLPDLPGHEKVDVVGEELLAGLYVTNCVASESLQCRVVVIEDIRHTGMVHPTE